MSPLPPLPSAAAIHVCRNEQTRDGWEWFAPHRERLKQLLTAGHALSDGARLCVLGAGNCNDLDLAALTNAFAEIHLVDLDQQAMAAGVERQGLALGSRVVLHGGTDLSGILPCLEALGKSRSPSDNELEHCLALARQGPALHLPAFDVAASTCLLSQMIDSIAQAIEPHHPRFFDLVATVRSRHARLLGELLKPGGRCILASDFVSSITYPPLGQTPLESLQRVVNALIAAGNFFTGLNPTALARMFHEDPVLRGIFAHASLTAPWLWDLGPRVYAVCALTAVRN